ncbi:H-type lectin domain-containing protein [Meinhardsimonia xiamenensis]|jgi:hypothetical protein|uniref:H-type lectin domain-containing protein n=1 Tax=Meinhardsimonia xiamenensis TaxID=990712 RepID=A0A1G8YWV6_9RHOB|nr:H-type lectin domain-containing protein [Meinhardsimonia xiamenensis]PRX37445.1 H-type lectin domain-containing protein [Meinhardsimonia xiamenensis]SDK06535.1 H-type lectin domain-containing protein [Meinhardsimonia xiamenensis]
MKKLRNYLIGLDQGSELMFSDFQHEGEMWTGEGPRESRRPIRFSEPFRGAPVVHVSLSMLDLDHARNHRTDLRAENVTATGFELVFRTWGDTRVARVRADWLAMGEARHPDDWDID